MNAQESSKQTNIEKLATFMEKEGPDLIPAFLALIEVCFHSEKHSTEEL